MGCYGCEVCGGYKDSHDDVCEEYGDGLICEMCQSDRACEDCSTVIDPIRWNLLEEADAMLPRCAACESKRAIPVPVAVEPEPPKRCRVCTTTLPNALNLTDGKHFYCSRCSMDSGHYVEHYQNWMRSVDAHFAATFKTNTDEEK